MGQKVYSLKNIDASSVEIGIAEFDAGIYLLSILDSYSEEEIFNTKIKIQ